VAEVLRAHGLEGAVQARLLADSWEALGRPSTLFLVEGRAAPGALEGAPDRPLAVESVRAAGRHLLLKLGGVDTREAAAALGGCRLGLPRDAAPPLPEGHYYHYDILGLAVVDAEGRDLGCVAAIVPTGANDVYVVQGPRGEWLLPALRQMITAVDIEAGVLRVGNVADLLEG
jgi:16S rRNA processing protein RimM